MTIKRIILAFLTFLAIAKIWLSLNDSLSQPQIQSRLELFQNNLVLHVTELKSEAANSENDDFVQAIDSIIGQEPYSAASKQYQKARTEAETSRQNFQAQLEKIKSVATTEDNSSVVAINDNRQISTNVAAQQQIKQTQKQIAELDSFINEIDLKQGILYAVQDNNSQAVAVWNQLISRVDNPQNKSVQAAVVLKNLWQPSPQVSNNSEQILNQKLDSWFRYQALAKLYQVENRTQDLANLQVQEQQTAQQAILKLTIIGGIPFLGGITGVILLIFLIVQLLLKPEKAILATNSDRLWETPWNWEITWQILIVGFFFIGQFILPLFFGILFGISGWNPENFGLRTKAIYVFTTYILMAVSGITVLYFSLKSFFPLSKDWFKFNWASNWLVWGFGGYLVAIPAVLVVSLINQQIWNGQGGSNPLLFLALQAQDKVALSIFFITASVAAPFFEELMFRGFLLPSLTRYLPLWGAIILSALIFAIAHLSLSEVLPLATLGVILGIVYTRSRNLLAPMLLHSLWNSGTLLSLFVLGSGI